MSQNNHFIGVWMPVSFIEQKWGEARKQSKEAINLANISQNGNPQAGDVFISSILPPTGGRGPEQRHFGLIFRQRGRVS